MQPCQGAAVNSNHFMDDRFVNLGEEVILNLQWQSGASESATVCFVISLSICYWLLRARVCVRERWSHLSTSASLIAACVCVCECERERERETVTSQRSVQRIRNRLNRGLCANTYEHHHCVCHATLFLFRAWTDGKTKDIIKLSLHSFWKLKLTIMERGVTFLTRFVVFGQQSEQTALVGRRDFVENDAFERGGA